MLHGSQRRIAYYFGPTGGKSTYPVVGDMTPPPTITTPYGEERTLRICLRDVPPDALVAKALAYQERMRQDAVQRRTREWNARRVS